MPLSSLQPCCRLGSWACLSASHHCRPWEPALNTASIVCPGMERPLRRASLSVALPASRNPLQHLVTPAPQTAWTTLSSPREKSGLIRWREGSLP